MDKLLKNICIGLLCLLNISIIAQTNCSYLLSGNVVCEGTNEILPFSVVNIKELKKEIVTNNNGYFKIDNICFGKYSLKISYIGHHTLDTIIEITKNTFINISLQSSETHLDEARIRLNTSKKQEIETLQKNEISGIEIDKTRGLSLGESLKSITGVNSIQTGPTISKPMIHGMYGNRVLILNNGVRLESQTWGADHAPEIDPFIANRLSVIKGAASIRYGTNAIAGVVMVDPKEMPRKKSLSGEINLVGTSNGKSGTASSYLEGAFDKKFSGLSWRIQGTLKDAGSYNTPTYYLSNSGVKENNYSFATSYKKSNYGIDIFYSVFDSKIGIYSGSHVGNLKDLYLVFNSPEPIVKSIFSYDINRGYQKVNHQLVKVNTFYQFKNAGKLIFTFARQENKRSEYGEDLSYNQAIVEQNIPDAYFQLITHTSELIWEHQAIKKISGSIGVNFKTQGNVYRGLDIRALIPNYRTYGGGIFILEKWKKDKLTVEFGARYDYEWMRTYKEDFTTLTLRSSEYNWQNTSATLGSNYALNKHLSLNTSLGIGWRPPAPIELFANGIHQSAASYEIGDSLLKSERSYNSQAYLTYENSKFQFEIGGYFNIIDNFIYLKPRLNPVITTAGVFPAFNYIQTNVYYKGVDANFNYQVTKTFGIHSKTTIVYAYDRSQHQYLIYVPANRFENGISYSKEKLWKLKKINCNLSVLTVGTQTRVPMNSDYTPPPKGYTLLNADINFSILVKQQLIGISVGVTNLSNVAYRDYLNRFRYYANDLGRNVTLRLKVPFSIFNTDSNNE